MHAEYSADHKEIEIYANGYFVASATLDKMSPEAHQALIPAPQWTVKAGRVLCSHGVECFIIHRPDGAGMFPVECDAMAQYVAEKLNAGDYPAFYNKHIGR